MGIFDIFTGANTTRGNDKYVRNHGGISDLIALEVRNSRKPGHKSFLEKLMIGKKHLKTKNKIGEKNSK
tara:strand:- start:5323 stop:5529 length:207 start_codon:yes stop_codon:yes gene_type:complete